MSVLYCVGIIFGTLAHIAMNELLFAPQLEVEFGAGYKRRSD